MFEVQKKREVFKPDVPKSVEMQQMDPVSIEAQRKINDERETPQFLPTQIQPLSANEPPAQATKAAKAGSSKGSKQNEPAPAQAPAPAPVEERILKQQRNEIYETHSDQQRMGIKSAILDNAAMDQLDKTLSSKFKNIVKDIEAYGKIDVIASSAEEVLKESKLLSRIRVNLAKHLKGLKNTASKEYRLTKMYVDYFHLSADGYLQVPEQRDANGEKPKYLTPVKVKPTYIDPRDDKEKTVKTRSAKDESLFPHEPSINDIRQGYIGDCYLLAALSSLVNANPQKIKECMRDNGDTVTVRFFKNVPGRPDSDGNPATLDATEAYYVTVEKIVPKNDEFASGSLWVQMIERAYAASKLHKANVAEPSYGDISKGLSGDFLFKMTGQKQRSVHTSISGLSSVKNYMDAVFSSVINRYETKGMSSSEGSNVDGSAYFRRHFLGDRTQLHYQTETGEANTADIARMVRTNDQITALHNFMKNVQTRVDTEGVKKAKPGEDVPKTKPKGDAQETATKDKVAYFSEVLRQEELRKIMNDLPFKDLPDDLFTADEKDVVKKLILRKYEKSPLANIYQPFSGSYSPEALNAYDDIEKSIANGDVVTCGTFKYKPEDVESEDELSGLNKEHLDQGIVQGHAYTVLGVEIRDGAKMLKLRNPWGFSGLAYSLNFEQQDISRKRTDDSEGIFLIELNDFMAAFDRYDVN